MIYDEFEGVVVMNRIKELRAAMRWQQRDLADLLHVGANTISRYENEQLGLDTKTIHALCDIFGCTSDYLLGRSKTPAPAIADEDADLVAAYHAADENIRKAIDALLFPEEKQDSQSAVS